MTEAATEGGNRSEGFAIAAPEGSGSTVELNAIELLPTRMTQLATISADDSWLAAQLGATFSTPRFFVGGGLLWINEENVDPVFSLRAGMPF